MYLRVKKNIYFITAVFLFSFFFSVTPTQAAFFQCSWTKAVPINDNASTTWPGSNDFMARICPKGYSEGAELSCGDGKAEGYKCCCISNASTTQAFLDSLPTNSGADSGVKAPKFTLPDFQIEIPGLKLSEVTCVDGTCEVPWISEYAFAFYSFGLNIVGVLAVLVLMAAGVLWIVSGGDTNKIARAKKLIAGSATGLILIVGANLILNSINPELVKKGNISISYIDKIDLYALSESEMGTAPSSAGSSHGVPWFFQCSPEGKATSYDLNGKCGDKSTICSSGCGAVSTLMVMSSLGQTPSFANWADKIEASGGRICFNGSASYGLIKAAESYGLKGRQLNGVADITKTLDEGHPVIISVRSVKKGSCKFTNGGHFIVLTGWRDKDKKIADVNDPANRSQKAERTHINLNNFDGCKLNQSFYLYK